MGKRGPKPKSAEIRKLDGTDYLRPEQENNPVPKYEAGMPGWLRPGARIYWRRIIESMPPGLYKRCDEGMLAAYCVQAELHEQAYRELYGKKRRCVLTEIGGNKSKAANPLIKIMTAASSEMAKLGTRLGLSPADRTAIDVSNTTTGGVVGGGDDDYGEDEQAGAETSWDSDLLG